MSLLGASLFLAFFIKEIVDNTPRDFHDENVWHPSANGVFFVSVICLLLAVPGRIACNPVYEDVMVMFSLLLTCPYFIYFLSPFKFIGPFLGMIDKMLWGDLLKFFAIYLVFLVGFSQAMYIAFIGTPSTLFNDPINALLGLFIMSLGEFQDIYASFDDTRYINLPKLLFVVYMILVTLLLINMLIAMMGNTFNKQDGKEWHRQWAKIILGNELAFPPDLRKKIKNRYAQTGRKASTEEQGNADVRSATDVCLQHRQRETFVCSLCLRPKYPNETTSGDETTSPSQDSERAPSRRKAKRIKLRASKVYVTRRHNENPAQPKKDCSTNTYCNCKPSEDPSEQDDAAKTLYDFVDLNGGGELVDLLNDAEIKQKIEDKIIHFLYEEGKGEHKPITEVIKKREDERQMRQKYNQVNNWWKSSKIEPLKNEIRKEGCREKFVCWNIDKRGKVGETILHICLLKNSADHKKLAKLLVEVFPKLVHDIYLGDEYYGESPLHMAIVNEDTDMVQFLLKNGADVTESCCGAFFLPDDQKEYCAFYPGSEVYQKTNYEGLTYWGEYPLSFAASLGQGEIFKLLLKKTESQEYVEEAKKNIQEAEKHEREAEKKMKEVEENILEAKKNISTFSCMHKTREKKKEDEKKMKEAREEMKAARKKSKEAKENMTLINNVDFNGNTALHMTVIHDQQDMYDLARERGADPNICNKQGLTPLNLAATLARKEMFDHILEYERDVYWTYGDVTCAAYALDGFDTIGENGEIDRKSALHIIVNQKGQEHLGLMNGIVLEILKEKWQCGQYYFYLKWFLFFVYLAILTANLYMRPGEWPPSANGVFFFSVICLLLAVPGRIACIPVYEDVMVMFSLLLTCPYFIYFLSPFKSIGPFLGMIDKMFWGDLMKFFAIYLVFLVGFSQAMYIAFIGTPSTLFNDPINALLGLFIMSLGEFQDIYASFDDTRYINLPKLLFVVYMILVTLLLINMLIAMMGNTFNKQTKDGKEWHRQWAKIILGNELAFPPALRKKIQDRYAQPGREASTEEKSNADVRSATDVCLQHRQGEASVCSLCLCPKDPNDTTSGDETTSPSQDSERAPSRRKTKRIKLRASKVYVTRRHENPAPPKKNCSTNTSCNCKFSEHSSS
ncbi:uncharacterized protein [Ptychodera flava]|uniref:uncharacterized protein n=1 Tax=Ptychodera flava TaxID=63121 RepID=UPI00396AB023